MILRLAIGAIIVLVGIWQCVFVAYSLGFGHWIFGTTLVLIAGAAVSYDLFKWLNASKD